ncbi:hypothetical protein C9439_00175 [archaeon SCG-AAA382B04]|nr:hypothetical protein C9439_00175 [archaeon SCG-AAA382B04]
MIVVLLVDDEESFLDLAETYLEKENKNFDVETSSSPSQALELMEANSYDCIVCDYQMPQTSGLELLEKLRKELDREVPFIIFTGKGREEVAIEALNLGANRYIQKGGDPKSQYGVLTDAIVQEVERSKAEERVEKARDRAQKYLDIADVIIVAIDRDQEVTEINERGCEVLGYDKDEIIGKNWYENFMPERVREEVVEETQEPLLSGKPGEAERYENPIVTKDGEERIISWKNSVIRNDDGETIGTLSSGRDITERKRAEEKLKESEERYRTLIENTSFGIGISKGIELIFANKKLLDIFMVDSVDRFNEKPPLYYLTPESKEKTKERMKKLSQGVEVPEFFEVDIVRIDGEQRTLELGFADITIDGEPCRLSTYNDITERKEAEEDLKRYKEAVQSSGDSIYMIDKDYRYVFANDEHISRLFDDGKIPSCNKNEVVGKKYAKIHPDKETDALKNNMEKVLEKNKPITEEYEFNTAEKWSNRTYSPVKHHESEENGGEGIIIVSKDTTERTEAEEREHFLNSLVTHNIRNRMQVVQGYLDLVREDVGEEGREKIEKATNSVEKTLNLTDKLRSMIEFTKKGEAKEINVEKLKSLITNAINKNKGEAKEKEISLEFEVAEEIGGEVKAGHFIEDVVHNLIENAIYHADCEEIKVFVTENQDEFILGVEDDGEGISDRKKDEIFDLDYSEKPSSGGLGLNLIKKIIQTYKGKVEVKDSDLGGARFDVHLKKANSLNRGGAGDV